MSLSVRFDRTGGPEVMQLVDVEVSAPGAGEVTIRHHAIGLNFIDTYQRSGLYPVSLPSGLGQEAAGEVIATGPDVTNYKVGDRVAYAGGPLGAYSEVRTLPQTSLVKLPDVVSSEGAAALMLKGMTAFYLLHLTYEVKPGTTMLVHAAAGGVGSVLVPWAKHLGARVIGTAGSLEKAELARAAGCDHVIQYRDQDVAAEVRRLTGGRGVDVVYDSVGKDTFYGSLDSLRPRGMLVSYGNASGKAPAFEPVLLAQKGSLFITRPILAHYTSTRQELDAAAEALFNVMARGIVSAQINQRYRLSEIARAHIELETRHTTGASVIIP